MPGFWDRLRDFVVPPPGQGTTAGNIFGNILTGGEWSGGMRQQYHGAGGGGAGVRAILRGELEDFRTTMGIGNRSRGRQESSVPNSFRYSGGRRNSRGTGGASHPITPLGPELDDPYQDSGSSQTILDRARQSPGGRPGANTPRGPTKGYGESVSRGTGSRGRGESRPGGYGFSDVASGVESGLAADMAVINAALNRSGPQIK